MSLKDFPHPTNGIGIHFDLDLRPDKLDAHIPLMADMHMGFSVFYTGDALQALNCARSAMKHNILPVIRPKCKIDGGIPDWETYVRSQKSVGAPAYIQIYNEPFDRREWNGSPSRDLFVNRWRDAANRIVAAGGYPGLQTLDEIDVRACFSNLSPSVAEKVFFCSHSYASGHPPSYPYDPRNQQDHLGATVFTDDTCVLRFIEEAEWCKNSLGFYCPIFVTEGGWVMQEQDDNRYPRITPELHARYHMEMYNWFRSRKLSNGDVLPDYLFGFAPFLLYDPDYQFFSWVSVAPQTIKAVKAMPPFVRKFSWEVDPMPEPIPPSISQSGIHWSNRENKGDPWSFPWRYIILLHHQIGDLAELRRRFPDALIEVRFYTDNWTAKDSRQWAEYIASRWNEINPYTLDVCAWNEQNLAGEGHPGGAHNDRVVPDIKCYQDMNAWNLQVIEALAELCPDMIFHYGALSQGHSDDQEDIETAENAPNKGQTSGYIGLEILQPSIQHPFVKYFDIHTYWWDEDTIDDLYYGRRYFKAMPFAAGKQFCISEYGSLRALELPNRAEQYRRWLSKVPFPVAAFIWYTYGRMNDEGKEIESSPWNLYDKPDMLDLFRNPPASEPLPPIYDILTDIQLAQLVRENNFAQLDTAIAIAFAESGGNPMALNPIPPDTSYGLWQINMIGDLGTKRRALYGLINNEDLFEPKTNARVAFGISDGGKNWYAWPTFTRGEYIAFLPRARAALQAFDTQILHSGIDAAQDLPHIAVNDQAWLYKYGVKYGAGFPECEEKYFDFGGGHYIFQEWSRAFLLMDQNQIQTARIIWK